MKSKSMKKSNFLPILFASFLPLWISCSGRVESTTVEIEDPIRHYYPIVEGEELWIDYEIRNTGKNALVISEIQTPCGCIAHDDTKRIISPGNSERLVFRYDSSKNRGLVRHQIRLYGNFETQSVALLEFDVQVIPPSDNGSDYEESLPVKKRKIAPDNYYVDGEF